MADGRPVRPAGRDRRAGRRPRRLIGTPCAGVHPIVGMTWTAHSDRAAVGIVARSQPGCPGMDLFAPVSLGDLQLANRVVMAPLTRLRSGDAGVPGELVAEHYAQRASVGLIITEGTFPNAESRAYPGQPGIVTDEQVEGWRRVAEAVHARGGRIVMQVMHGGRVSHPDVTGTDRIVAPSAIAIQGEVRTPARKAALPRAARADHRRGAGHAGRHRRRVGARGRRRAGRRRDPQRQRLPAARVPVARRPTSAPTSTAAARRTGPASSSRSPPRSPRRSAPARSASASRPSTTSRTRSRPTAPTCWPPTAPWSTGCARWGSPT